MEYTIERLKKCITDYEFAKCVYIYKGAKLEINQDSLYDDIWNELDGIDEDLIPALTELNEKGYRTNGCCSGHLEQFKDGGYWRIYISFNEDYNGLENIPLNKSGLIYEINGSKKGTVEEKEKARQDKLKELLEWAQELDRCEYNDPYGIKDGWVIHCNEKIYKLN